ncbi:bacterioferritin-associated ferredoxin [Dactylosporangium sp. NPDC051541]|uniref:bacterioferritin-associated ferredoxin n=1 Tax=Dactylosporangium sp. NPDC051541 TaxID=3363977 RepID=UPI00379994F9
MYVCICHRVRECEIRRVVQAGARSEDAVGDECGAGTGCGTCLDRIADLIDAENSDAVPVLT